MLILHARKQQERFCSVYIKKVDSLFKLYIIVFNKEKEIVYTTDELEITNEKEITFDYLRSYYIIENFNQKISSYLSSSKSVIIQSISEVFYQKDESKLPLSQVLPAFQRSLLNLAQK